jgi:hypothetical protein
MADNLDKVTVHADMLDKVANDMTEDGIGLHPTRGHVASLRAMASAMRVDKANGKVPHAWTDNSYYASAEGQGQLPAPVIRTLSACGLMDDGEISLAAFDEASSKAGIAIDARLEVKQALAQAGRLVA